PRPRASGGEVRPGTHPRPLPTPDRSGRPPRARRGAARAGPGWTRAPRRGHRAGLSRERDRPSHAAARSRDRAAPGRRLRAVVPGGGDDHGSPDRAERGLGLLRGGVVGLRFRTVSAAVGHHRAALALLDVVDDRLERADDLVLGDLGALELKRECEALLARLEAEHEVAGPTLRGLGARLLGQPARVLTRRSFLLKALDERQHFPGISLPNYLQ